MVRTLFVWTELSCEVIFWHMVGRCIVEHSEFISAQDPPQSEESPVLVL